MNDYTDQKPTRPLGVAHLIFGLIFTGIAATWIIGQANHTDVPDLAIGLPIVLIGAGILGLGASVWNQRRNRARLLTQTQTPTEEPAYAEAPEPLTGTSTYDTPDPTETTKDLS